jgi:hypothetical protein
MKSFYKPEEDYFFLNFFYKVTLETSQRLFQHKVEMELKNHYKSK